MGNRGRIKEFLKRLTAMLMVICLVLTMSGVGMLIEYIIGGISTALADKDTGEIGLVTDPGKAELYDHMVFTDEMDAVSTTVFFSHWHLMTSDGRDSGVATDASRVSDEYRFYPYTDSSDNKYVYLFAKITNFDNIKNKTNLYTGTDGESKEEIQEKQANEFELVKIFTIENDDYSHVQFVISPQIPNPLAENAAEEKFSNFSISSGHDSTAIYFALDKEKDGDYNDFHDFDDSLGAVPENLPAFRSAEYPDGKYPEDYARVVVTYHPESVNHVIKGHAFYVDDIVTMVGADFATETFFTIPEDAVDYDEAHPDRNRLVENPYLVWENDMSAALDHNYGNSNDYAKIVYTGEIDTHSYIYNAKVKDANGDETVEEKTVIYYNTSSGLHTNKTAYVTDGATDGRTYDVELETWYAGEDIADVGFILDASGSMAWTTDVIEPLAFTESQVKALKDAYPNVNWDEYISTYGEGGTAATKFLTTAQVNMLLNPANTDNTRLSYSEYNYYIYDARSSSDEFVPLGYWGGNLVPKVASSGTDYKILGYYPFDGSLKNEAKNGNSATLIEHSNWSTSIPDQVITTPVTYASNGLDVFATGRGGNIWLDVDTSSLDIDNFTIQFDVSGTVEASISTWLPFLYVGDVEKNKFFTINHGNSGNTTRVGVYSGSTRLRRTNTGATPNKDTDVFTVTVVVENGTVTILKNGTDITDNNSDNRLTTNYLNGLSSEDICFILGGQDLPGYASDNSSIKVKNVIIATGAHKARLTGAEDYVIGNYSLNGDLNNSKDSTHNGKYIANAENGKFDLDSTPQTISSGIAYTNSAYSGKALDITETAKNGAVILDAVPSDSSNFTISFAVLKGGGNDGKGTTNGTAVGNILYIGDKDTNKEDYYLIHRRNAGYLELYHKNASTVQGSASGTYADSDHLYFQGAFANSDEWKVITFTVKDIGNNKVEITPYVDGKPEDNGFPNGSSNGQIYVPESMDSIVADKDNLAIVLGGLWNSTYATEYANVYLYLDELYVLDKALTKDEVADLYNDKYVNASAGEQYIVACDDNGNVIGKLPDNTDSSTFPASASERAGWYYVNSHSRWTEIQKEGIATGKELEPVKSEATNYPVGDAANSFIKMISEKVNEPKAKSKITNSDILYNSDVIGGNPNFVYPSKSIPSMFFLVKIGDKYYLRCYFNTGSNTSAGVTDARAASTQCSYIYYKPDDQRIKVETLQYALNSFTANLHNESPRSRVSAVRFSVRGITTEIRGSASNKTEIPIGDVNPESLEAKYNSNGEDPYYRNENHFDDPTSSSNSNYVKEGFNVAADNMVLLDWTKSINSGVISARRGKLNNGDSAAGYDPSNPTVEDENDKSNNSLEYVDGYDYTYGSINQYNYYLTGGTYTWTGLKAFYTQLASRDDRIYNGDETSVVDSEKYVILFTDGRDNTVESVAGINAEDIEKIKTYANGVSNSKVLSYNEGGQSLVNTPAKLWADKLKAEGYTVFCVMLASGSIDPEFNESEYYTALTYLSYLIAGPAYEDLDRLEETGNKDGKVTDDELISHYRTDPTDENNYVFVAQGDQQLNEMFDAILKRINSELNDYVVQDYIDPRFDLVEEEEIDSYTVHMDEKGNEIDEKDCLHEYDITYSSVHTHTIKLGAKGEISFDDCSVVYYRTDIYGKKVKIKKNELPGNINLDTVWVDVAPSTLDTDNFYTYTALDGKEARLFYNDKYYPIDGNSGNTANDNLDQYDAYYLKWIDVDIPGCAIGAPIVEVWNSRIRLKAKDDFIGGNDILTNGNLGNMNYVYPTKTLDKYIKGQKVTLMTTGSSGTNKADPQLEKATGYYKPAGSDSDVAYDYAYYLPSKGFPRVTVNVRLLPIDTKDITTEIYMGETIAPAYMLMDVENEYMSDSYYLEYLKRYAYQRYLSYRNQYNDILNQLTDQGEYDAAVDMLERYKEQKNIYSDNEIIYETIINQYPDLGAQITATLKAIDDNQLALDQINARLEDYDNQLKAAQAIGDADKIKQLETLISNDNEVLTYQNKVKDMLEAKMEELTAAETKRDSANAAMEEAQNEMDAIADELSRNYNGIDAATLVKLREQMDMPLIDLLNEWLKINTDEIPKSFSLPYIYLPSVKYSFEGDSTYPGKVETNGDYGEASKVLNSTGNIYNENDVVGILTYKWVQLDPVTEEPLKDENGQDVDPTIDYVKDDTTSVVYSLTVEFTPIKQMTSAADYGVTQGENDEGKGILVNSADSIFSRFLGIDDEDIVLDTVNVEYPYLYYFSRLYQLNGNIKKGTTDVTDIDNRYNDGLIQETQEKDNLETDVEYDSNNKEVKAPGTYVPVDTDLNKNVYRWDRYYKKTVGDEQIQNDYELTDNDKTPKIDIKLADGTVVETKVPVYGEVVELINDGKTLAAKTKYTKDVVSAGVALELKVPVDDLEEVLASLGGYHETFTLSAKRTFIDFDFVEQMKNVALASVRTTGNKLYDDYTGDFYLTFTFDYDSEMVYDAINEAYESDSKYATLYARIEKDGIYAQWKHSEPDETHEENGSTVVDSYKSVTEWRKLSELPIGTYTFDLTYDLDNDVYSICNNLPVIDGDGVLSVSGKATFNSKNFTYIGVENDEDAYKAEIPYDYEYDLSKENLTPDENDKFSGLIFNEVVTNGLWTTDADQTIKNPRTYDVYDEYGILVSKDNKLFTRPEIYNSETDGDHVTGYIADNSKNYDKKTATFYFGTNKDYNGDGTTTNRVTPITMRSDFTPENYPEDGYYIDDRLGIIVLSLGDDDLIIDKTVERTSNEDDYTMLWGFDVILKSSYPLSNTNSISYNAVYFDYEDLDENGNPYFKGKEFVDGKEDEYDFFENAYTKNGKISGRENNYSKQVVFTLVKSDTKFGTNQYGQDDDGNYVYKATVYLTHYQRVVLENMGWEYGVDYTNITYIVQEIGDKEKVYKPFTDDYDVTMTQNGADYENIGRKNIVTGLLGENADGSASIICYTNTFPYAKLPASGGTGTHGYTIAGIIMIIMSSMLLGYVYYIDRKQRRMKVG